MEGIYIWSYAGGQFEVELRPNGVFYCKSYSVSNSSWHLKSPSDKDVIIDWKKYGTYEFVTSSEGKFDGFVVGKPENWRKMEWLRSFSLEEKLLLGSEGFGTAWNFEYQGGSFEVRFLVDSFNHFDCPQFPAHSHWKMTSPTSLEIKWGKYGDYELNILGESNQLQGSKKNQPDNWRKASLIRSLTADDVSKVNTGHDHAHAHEHH